MQPLDLALPGVYDDPTATEGGFILQQAAGLAGRMPCLMHPATGKTQEPLPLKLHIPLRATRRSTKPIAWPENPQGFPNLRLRQGRLVTGVPVLSLGLPHGGTEVQPLTYVLEHWETGSKIDLR